MKAINITYWVCTVIIAGMMLFSGVTNAMVNEASVKMISHDMGYPQYMIGFLGVAKICGAIAILIPAFPRLKEWAYAGLLFDLLGATYSIVSSGDNGGGLAFMTVLIAVGFTSYALYHKVNKPVLSLAV